MQSRRAFLRHTLTLAAVGAATAACGSAGSDGGAPAAGPTPAAAPITGATAITEVFGDGQKLTAVALEYPKPIRSAALTPAAFTVADRTVTKVYANTAATTAPQGADGRFVVVELSTGDAAAALYGMPAPGGAAGTAPPGTGSPAGQGGSTATGQGGPPAGGQGGPPAAGQAGTPPTIKAATATVTQAGAVTATDGTTYPASTSAVTTSAVVNLVVDDFRQFTFDDPATGQSLKYNLFVPKNYDKSRSYPLVLFMHDAGPVGGPTIAPLVQGLGAVCWAGPADQAVRESFVVAPAYPTVVIDDTYRPTALFDATVNLVEDLPRRYSIDRTRVYATGQSMGAMMTIGMNIRHPDLLAASFVVAGQWPTADVAPLATKKLWVVVSQGDDKAFPGENAIMDVIAQRGTAISRATWDGRSTAAQFAADVQTVLAPGSPVNYASFVKGSLLPAGSTGGSEHTLTWPVAYTIDGIRDWVFQQHL